ncbi:GNAT family N-acetyltransferase [Sphingomonas sp. LB-2]|uniref:GNAT family N-acetyltransferase n=1 Tax=Sphingomonas caeni TaxID=2984949 RepID=UPI00222F9685|nr:GNAT family N-acetyltransferase [Sphingomonas caeni]MCW3848919.1 GNAT family N-acetyltransferase [Sphingomonas caeni]
MGLIPVPDEQVACIVTSLEMLTRPAPRPAPPSPFALVRWHAPSPARYKTLFRRVGEPWLWFSRLVMDEERLRAIIEDEAVEIYAVTDRAGIEVGMLELDFRVAETCELGFFGLVPELNGQGHGGWLMHQALTLAWRKGVARVWVHTCTLDHPGALRFYRRHGFVPFKRMVESFADPRLAGILPAEAAPHIPVLGGGSAR